MSYINTSYNIHKFKKGDEITRVNIAPLSYQDKSFESIDSQLIGQKVIFLGLANGCIYMERATAVEKMLTGSIFTLPIDIYEEGWNYYENPEFLEGKETVLTMMEKSLTGPRIKALENIRKKALDEDNFELLKKIDEKLEDLKNEEISDEDLDDPNFLFKNLNSGEDEGLDGLLGGLLGGQGPEED